MKAPMPGKGAGLAKPGSLALAGLIGAVYGAVTILLAPLSYGPVQVRVAESLAVLPYLLPEAVPGLFVGCLIANFAGGYGVLDALLGSGATLAAALISAKMPNAWLASLPPVFINMVVVGGYLSWLLDIPFIACALYIGLGQAASCCLLGIPLALFLERRIKKGGDSPAR